MSLNATELAGMQATLNGSLPDTCSIDHVTKVPDGAGGRTETIVTTAGVQCRFSEASDKKGGELIEANVLIASSAWLFTLPVGTQISVLDRIRVGSRTWEVAQFYIRSWLVDLRVYCREVLD